MSESDATAPQSPPPGAGAGRAGWVVAAVVIAAGLGLLLWSERPPSLLERGASAPGFSLPRLSDGAEVSLDDYRGRVVLVNFWATWCKPCEDEIPAMERLYQTLRSDGFEILAISVDTGRSEVEAFRERLGISFPILLDPGQGVSRQYQTTGYPESLLVDTSGLVVERYIGPRDWDHPMFARRIRQLMDEPG